MGEEILPAILGSGLKLKELKKNKIPDKYVSYILNGFESEEKIKYSIAYDINDSLAQLIGGKNKKDFQNIEKILSENTGLKIPSEYYWKDTKKRDSKIIDIPKNTSQEQVFVWLEKYCLHFSDFRISIVYLNLPKNFLENSGLPKEKLGNFPSGGSCSI